MSKFKDVYDNVKFKTPMRRLMEEQAAKQKLKEEVKEDGKPNTNNRKSRSNSGTDK